MAQPLPDLLDMLAAAGLAADVLRPSDEERAARVVTKLKAYKARHRG